MNSEPPNDASSSSPPTGSVRQRMPLVYALLGAAWLLVVAWQAFEHDRVKANARAALVDRSRDITTTLGLLIRSQRRWGAVDQERLESALKELVSSEQLASVAMLSAVGDVVASAGAPIDLETSGMPPTGIRWDRDRLILVNLVDLGVNLSQPEEEARPTIVVPRRPENEPPPRPRPRPPPESSESSPIGPDGDGRGERRERVREDSDRGDWGERRGERRRPFGRPPWMTPDEFSELIQKRGLHGVVITMSTEAYHRASSQDFWLRGVITGFAGISALGLGLAWRNLGKSAQLQMRLLRASELNAHLKEMNIAAAGLAHETRNPLNIIRGQAQLISRHPEATSEVREKLSHIIDETDRVTAQLNEFISYSRPREPRMAPVEVGHVAREVARTLDCDLEEKRIALEIDDNGLTVDADEALVRQALFNLLLNAIQALPPGGKIQVHASRANPTEAVLEIRDNGPGVDPENQTQIFKPYFTTHQEGTGLGLAVVHQIVLAHGWEIHYLPNQPTGAIFRVIHLKLTTKSDHAAGIQASPTYSDRR